MSVPLAKSLLFILNFSFLLLIFWQTIYQFRDEKEYNGNLEMLFRFVRPLIEMAKRDGYQRRQIVIQFVRALFPIFAWMFLYSYLSIQAHLDNIGSTLISNLVVFLLLVLPLVWIYRAILTDQLYKPNGAFQRWLIKKGEPISSDELVLEFDEASEELENIEAENSVNPDAIQSENAVKPSAEESIQILKEKTALRKLKEMETVVKSPAHQALLDNSAIQYFEVLENSFKNQSDEEKHIEYIRSRRTSWIIFVIIAASTFVPIIQW